MNLADRIKQIEAERDDYATLESQRNALQQQLQAQVTENAELRRVNDQLKAAAAARQAQDAERRTLAVLLAETSRSLLAQLGGA